MTHSRNQVEERDFNDLLDDIVLIEENCAAAGYQEGFSIGCKKGNEEGYRLGYKQGLALGNELAEIYGKIVALQQVQHTERVRRALNQLREAINKFPRENQSDADIIGSLENIRLLYKKLCVMLWTVQPSQPSAKLNLSETNNISF
ncbi:uncharacterized protein ACN427_000836 [Glossina fuscipes fuscipes]